MKDFIKGIVKSFVIGPDDTTVAVATFSSASRFLVQFDFTKYSTKEAIVDAVQNIPYYGGYTYTGIALYRVRTRLFPLARAGVPHILIVLTDGRANDDVDDHAEALRDTGVHIISVGVGNADHRELEEIASKPADENVFMASFDSVVSLASSILEDVCKGERKQKQFLVFVNISASERLARLDFVRVWHSTWLNRRVLEISFPINRLSKCSVAVISFPV